MESVNHNQEKLFFLEDHILKKQMKKQKKVEKAKSGTNAQMERFEKLCKDVLDYFMEDWKKAKGSGEVTDDLLSIQKRAIIGYEENVNYFQDRIEDYLKNNGLLTEWKPPWYDSLKTAIFHENWGVAGIYEWKNLKDSSSAKIIGDRIYFLIDGKMKLQPQKIQPERMKQLIQALLLKDPEIRLADTNRAEVYMLDQTRVAVYNTPLVKQPAIVFRKDIVPELTFEEQADRGTIPREMIKMLKAMVKIGFNIVILGPVRSAKTTLLKTFEMYEDPTLEGVQIETDPEIPQHELKPEAPIIQFVADGEELRGLMKPIKRTDADYIVAAEAREGISLSIGLGATKIGTRRVKATFHDGDPIMFPYNAANEIINAVGGDLYGTIISICNGFHYIPVMAQLKDKSLKRLIGLYEMRYDPFTFEVTIHQIMKYHPLSDKWTFKHDIGKDKERIAEYEDYEAFKEFDQELKELAEKYPMEGEHVYRLPYLNMMMGRR